MCCGFVWAVRISEEYIERICARAFFSASIMRVANLLRILLYIEAIPLIEDETRAYCNRDNAHENRIIMLYSFVTIKKKILIELLQHTIIRMNNNLIPSITAIR